MINCVVTLLREVSMVVQLTGHSGSPVVPIPKSVAQVRDLIAARIERGDPGYKPGEKLPTHEALAAALPSSRTSVARAIALLKDDGLLVGVRGSGVYVAER